jgi:hypothetical protein
MRRVAVIIAHNSGKNGALRGYKAMEDSLDISVRLSPAERAEEGEGAHFKVEFTKSRGVFGDAIKPFAAKLAKNEAGKFYWELGGNEEYAEGRLLKILERFGEMSATLAAKSVGVSNATISRICKRLEERGLLEPKRHFRDTLRLMAKNGKNVN